MPFSPRTPITVFFRLRVAIICQNGSWDFSGQTYKHESWPDETCPFVATFLNTLTPFTYIDYEAKPNGLHVFTYHAFPADLTIVKTQSIFELA